MTLPGWINRTNIYYFTLALTLVSLPLSKYVMSMAQLMMVTNWLVDPAIFRKFRDFFKNRAAVVIVSFFLLHVVGLIWTTDFDYALKDLRTKLPILALPIIISTSPKIDRKLFYQFMILFIAANVAGSVFSMKELLVKDIHEIRMISLFISHIRFSLNICVAVFAGMYLVFVVKFGNTATKSAIIVAIVWLLAFLVILEAITGLVIFLITSVMLSILFIFHSKTRWLQYSTAFLVVILPVFVFLYLRSIYLETIPKKPFNEPDLEKFTALGNPYLHDSTLKGTENGFWTGQYIQQDEMREVWNARSSIKYDSMDASGNYLRFTLIRFLTSKGLRKDAEGVKALSEKEVKAVESGMANVRYLAKTSLKTRIMTIFWEIQLYRESGYMSGHSVAQRFEFWRAAGRIIQENFWLGTGTGDIVNAFQVEYEEMKTTLEPLYRWRSHNQYMSVLATLGIFGLIWFLVVLIYPAWHLKMYSDYFFVVFFIILLISMITEDTIESQAGCTFYAFFTTFFLLARKEKDKLFMK